MGYAEIECRYGNEEFMREESEKKRAKKWLCVIAVLNIIMLLLACLAYRKDVYTREIGLSEFLLSADAAGCMSQTEDGKGMVLDATALDLGQALYGPYIGVPKGNYTLVLEYTAMAEGVSCEVYSNGFVNEDNSRGKTFVEEELPAGTHTIEIPYTVDRVVKDMEYKFYVHGGSFTLVSVTNRSDHRFTDAFLAFLLFVFWEGIVLFLYRRQKEGNKETVWNFVLLTLLGLAASVPLFNDFQTMTMDHMIHYARIDDIADWIRNFSWRQPVMRLAGSQHNDYGYITPIMYPQLFLYFPAVLRLCGGSMLFAYKALVLVANLATAYLGYFSFKRLLGNNRRLGFLCTALYVMNLYRLTDFYTRGAIGESLAMVFLPLVLYGMYEILYGESRRWYYALLGYTGVLQSHILTTFMLALFCVLAVLAGGKKLFAEKERLLALLKAAGSTVLWNLWFLVPFIQCQGLDLIIKGAGSNLDKSGVYLSQVFALFVENAGVNQLKGSTQNEMPLTIGLIIPVGCALFGLYRYRNKDREERLCEIGAGSFVLGLVALFLSSVYFPWETILCTGIGSVFHAMQYAWRFLTMAALFGSVTAAIGLYQLLPGKLSSEEKEKTGYAMFAIVGVVVLCSGYYLDSCIGAESVSKSFCEVTREMDELYLPRAAAGTKDRLSGTLSANEGCEMEVTELRRGYAELSANLKITKASPEDYIDLPLFDYPGYVVTDQNGEKVAFKQSDQGLIRVAAEESLTEIHAFFREPVLWRIATVLSLIGILTQCVYLFRQRCRH